MTHSQTQFIALSAMSGILLFGWGLAILVGA